MFQDSNRLLLAVSYAILLGLLYGARGLCERGDLWAFWGVSLVLGGAIALVGLVAGLVIWRRKRATSREEAVSALRRRR